METEYVRGRRLLLHRYSNYYSAASPSSFRVCVYVRLKPNGLATGDLAFGVKEESDEGTESHIEQQDNAIEDATSFSKCARLYEASSKKTSQ